MDGETQRKDCCSLSNSWRQHRVWWCAAGLALAGFLALAVDIPVAQWFLGGRVPGDFRKPINFIEVFGHGSGVVMILMVVWVLDPVSRASLVRLAACAYGSGLVADGCKLLIARARPRKCDFNASIFETFEGWFPLLHFEEVQQSCPSSHMATGMGLAIGLAWRYPRGRWLFPALAALVGLQRLLNGSHFLSDVLWGAAIGFTVSHCILPGGFMTRGFDRLERRWTPAQPIVSDAAPRQSRAA